MWMTGRLARFLPAPATEEGAGVAEAVVLLHGLARTDASLAPMALALKASGFRPTRTPQAMVTRVQRFSSS